MGQPECALKLLDTVALTTAQGVLPAGLVGVLVGLWQPGVFEVEFAGLDGATYARAAVPEIHLLRLRHALEDIA